MHLEYVRALFGGRTVVLPKCLTVLILVLMVCDRLGTISLAAEPVKEVHSEADLPVNSIRSSVLEAYVAAHDTQKPDIWQARDVTLSEGDHLTEVRVGILDSGVDTDLYPDQLFHHPKSEPYPTQGLAFTDEGYPSKETLEPLSPEQTKVYATMQ